MYLETKGNYNYIIKKVGTKKIGVSIGNRKNVLISDIEKLTRKEFENVKNKDNYIKFKEILYNPKSFDEIYFQSLFFLNQMNNKFFKNDELDLKFDFFPIKFIYESNKTEGSKIPFESVEKIIKEEKYTYKVKNEVKEVENSIKVWHFIRNKFIFNIVNIKKVYHMLTKGLLQENGLKYPRGFKKVDIIVNNSLTSTPQNTENEIQNLLQNYKNNLKVENPLKLAFDFHLKYEQIHPFENGNGRTGRFLLNKILLSNGMLPIIVFEKNRKAYFNAIKSANSGNKNKYYKFMFEQYTKTINKYWK